MTLTVKELQLLKDLDSMGDFCWTDCIEDYSSFNGKELSGLLSSLNKKEIVFSDSGRDGTFRITDKGYDYIKKEEII